MEEKLKNKTKSDDNSKTKTDEEDKMFLSDEGYFDI